MTLISTSHDLQQFLNSIPPHPPYVALDTEFMREKTYWPQVCLIQMAVGEQAVAIDVLADGLDLNPLWEFLKKPNLLKVFHAARQDLEGFFRLTGEILTPFFDTQLAAMAYGMRESISYEDLVSTLLGHTLDKSQRVVDWTQRPLSEQKLQYALGDVIYLMQIYPVVAQQLKEWKRDNWIEQEIEILSSRATYLPNPQKAWKKVKGWTYIRGLTPSGFLLLQKIAAWREEQASAQNIARRGILSDETLCSYVSSFQKDPSFLESDIRDGALKETLHSLIDDIQKTPPVSFPSLPKRPPVSPSERELQKSLSLLLQQSATKNAVASRLIGTRDDLERLVQKWSRHPHVSHLYPDPLLTGWRYDIFGKAALEIFERMD